MAPDSPSRGHSTKPALASNGASSSADPAGAAGAPTWVDVMTQGSDDQGPAINGLWEVEASSSADSDSSEGSFARRMRQLGILDLKKKGKAKAFLTAIPLVALPQVSLTARSKVAQLHDGCPPLSAAPGAHQTMEGRRGAIYRPSLRRHGTGRRWLAADKANDVVYRHSIIKLATAAVQGSGRAVTPLNGDHYMGCHKVPFPYRMYYCHMTPVLLDRSYIVSLCGIGKGLAADMLPCSSGIRGASHPPGTLMCHFTPYANSVFGKKAIK
ncbi:hypothetical protein EJB05_57842, partial [Eragrostis curvula]